MYLALIYTSQWSHHKLLASIACWNGYNQVPIEAGVDVNINARKTLLNVKNIPLKLKDELDLLKWLLAFGLDLSIGLIKEEW